MRRFRTVLWIAIAFLAALLVWGTVFGPGGNIRQSIEQAASIGGPFDLVRTDGAAITDKDLQGRPHAIFFGFTHCPEICPTTLFEASGWLEALGPLADQLNIYFITVDPERDTREILADYMSAFDARMIGITGTPEKIQQVVQAYRVYVKKVPLDDGDYTVDHTATVYLMNADGTFSGTISWGEEAGVAVEKLKNLIKNNPA